MYTWNQIQDCHGNSGIQQEKKLFINKLNLNVRKKKTSKMLHLEHRFVRCWNLWYWWKMFWNHLAVLKCTVEEEERWLVGPIMWKMKKSYRGTEERNILPTIKWREVNWIDHCLCRNCLLKQIISGKMEGMVRPGRRYKQLPDDLKENRRYWSYKKEAQDYTLWRTHCGNGYGPVTRQTT